MKTGFSLLEILHRENPVFITGMGLQCCNRNYPKTWLLIGFITTLEISVGSDIEGCVELLISYYVHCASTDEDILDESY